MKTYDQFWQARVAAPLDRAIWARFKISTPMNVGVRHELVDSYARWDAASLQWVDARNLPIGRGGEQASVGVLPLQWMSLEERAASGDETEHEVRANIYYWDSEARREKKQAGFFAVFSVMNRLTFTLSVDRDAGPFATRAEAAVELAAMLCETHSEGGK